MGPSPGPIPNRMISMIGRQTNELIIRDILDRDAHALLTSTMNGVNIGIMLTSLDHVTLAVNERFGEIWGVDPHRVVQGEVAEIRDMVAVRIPDVKAWEDQLEHVYSDISRSQTDELVLTNPGLVILRFTGPVRDETGKIVGRLWTFEDITDLAKARRISEVIGELSLLVDPEPSVVYECLTQRIAEFYGSLAVLSICQGDYMSFLTVRGFAEDQARAAGGNALQDSYCQFCLSADAPIVIQDSRKDVRYASVLPATLGLTRYAGVPVRNPIGETIGTFCILDWKSDEILDVADLQLLSLISMRIASELERERQLQLLRSDLQHKTEELAIAQSAMIQREKLAVTGALSASIAHDIRNILSALSLEITMGADDPTRTLNTVQDHLDRFNVLSHRLLSYAKPKQVVREPVSLGECLDRVVSLLQRNLDVAKIHLTVNCASDVPSIWADQGRIDHVFINLVLNSLQAMKAGGDIRITVHYDAVHVIAEVEDTGLGMSADQLESLFKPFQSKRASGFGLGLFSVKQIVDECAAKIIYGRAPSGGSVFTIHWPRRSDDDSSL